MRRCLVLGGGGVAGIAWQVGVVNGLARAGVLLQAAELFIGTSAGAVVGAQLAAQVPIAQLYQQQIAPPGDSPEQFRPYSQASADEQNRKLFAKVGGDLNAARQRIGAFALRSPTVPAATRRAIVAARLPGTDWPSAPLKVVAVDVLDGRRCIFDAASGVDFVNAVAASCAVPGTWPVVEINGAAYMDGGIHSITNADLAAGFDRVIVLSPFGYSDGNPVSGHLRAEVELLRDHGAQVLVLEPDPASLDALGENVLDPSRRPDAARAGDRQAHELGVKIGAAWSLY